MAACRSQPVETTSVEYIRQTLSDGEIAPCRSATGSDPGMMDSYMVEIWEYNDNASSLSEGGILASSSNTSECQRCIASSDVCHLERQRICRCGPRMHVDPAQLGPSLAGLRVEGIDANYAYCLRAIAIDSGSLGSSAPPAPDADTDCDCDDEWSMTPFLMDSARLCAMSERAAAGPVGFEMYITCPGDGVNFRFPTLNSTPYQQCLFPTAN
jgi:hypothetical protein